MKKGGHWLHGFLDLCLLALLRSGPDYGFGLAQRLERAGLGEVPGGTLYPALLRLEQRGWVHVRWAASDAGPRRKYYELTGAGRQALDRDAAAWRRFRAGIDGLVGPDPIDGPIDGLVGAGPTEADPGAAAGIGRPGLGSGDVGSGDTGSGDADGSGVAPLPALGGRGGEPS